LGDPGPLGHNAAPHNLSCAMRLLELLFGGNMIEGMLKAYFWIGVFCAILAFTV